MSKISEKSSPYAYFEGEFNLAPARDQHNEFVRFSIPLLTIEIVSESSRENDLYFKPYFYETLGVQEFFVGETQEEIGNIVRGYRLEKGKYRPITSEHKGYYSEVAGHFIPQAWEL